MALRLCADRPRADDDAQRAAQPGRQRQLHAHGHQPRHHVRARPADHRLDAAGGPELRFGLGHRLDCTAAGQTVTARSGALAAGAAAPGLTIAVNVAAGASGALTHGDRLGHRRRRQHRQQHRHRQLRHPDRALRLLRARRVELGRDRRRQRQRAQRQRAGQRQPHGPTVPSPLRRRDPRLARHLRRRLGADISTSATGINTGIDVNSLGNAGTIGFWYASRTTWNDGNPRMLFDASNDLPAATGTSSSSRTAAASCASRSRTARAPPRPRPPRATATRPTSGTTSR
ncbi:MAG: hypothetical protein MZW92_57980 [Comamonadaceae bacterium]|nr:hypothetical protein [Comamonadaceae bacterium]